MAIASDFLPKSRPGIILARIMSIGMLAVSLAACATAGVPEDRSLTYPEPAVAQQPAANDIDRYQAHTDEPFPVAAVDTDRIGGKYLKQLVDYPSEYPVGTIVVDPANRFLYLVKAEGKAVRYGVGVGKAGFEFSGTAHVGFKRQWPRWTPTPDMIRRDPKRYGKWSNGMDGSDKNPLGARAMYLVKDGKDTLYRIHGTNEPWTIGTAASSGCIRMLNQDVIDLYRQIPTGADVVVLGAHAPTSTSGGA